MIDPQAEVDSRRERGAHRHGHVQPLARRRHPGCRWCVRTQWPPIPRGSAPGTRVPTQAFRPEHARGWCRSDRSASAWPPCGSSAPDITLLNSLRSMSRRECASPAAASSSGMPTTIPGLPGRRRTGSRRSLSCALAITRFEQTRPLASGEPAGRRRGGQKSEPSLFATVSARYPCGCAAQRQQLLEARDRCLRISGIRRA